ncbi:gastrula zinc finger protein XlCGF44.2-like [Pseudomyrmex gracilis]|uniref:gastrula zinc finger protein XlCGF44.2-like n=1 Tax=Pseudomyrmex gracilis TaxID=219809 RepID=UPI00099528B8|nr:gastrula zinc finger protein XlCGF44.2-like [Pseudomyrmex gracilis]
MKFSSDAAYLVEYDYGTRFLRCRKCDHYFPSLLDWEDHHFHYHMKLKYMCTHCDYRYLNKMSLVVHMQVKHNKQWFYCFMCEIMFFYPNAIIAHIQNVHSTATNPFEYECNRCIPPRKQPNFYTLLHEHKYDHAEPGTWFICRICGKECDNAKQLSIHRATHYDAQKRICTHCKKSFSCLVNLKRHISEYHKRFPCPNCFDGYSVEMKKDLQLHIKYNHETKLL